MCSHSSSSTIAKFPQAEIERANLLTTNHGHSAHHLKRKKQSPTNALGNLISGHTVVITRPMATPASTPRSAVSAWMLTAVPSMSTMPVRRHVQSRTRRYPPIDDHHQGVARGPTARSRHSARDTARLSCCRVRSWSGRGVLCAKRIILAEADNDKLKALAAIMPLLPSLANHFCF